MTGKLYTATFWDGSVWVNLHPTPLSFRAASDVAFSALLDGRGTTRLRLEALATGEPRLAGAAP